MIKLEFTSQVVKFNILAEAKSQTYIVYGKIKYFGQNKFQNKTVNYTYMVKFTTTTKVNFSHFYYNLRRPY